MAVQYGSGDEMGRIADLAFVMVLTGVMLMSGCIYMSDFSSAGLRPLNESRANHTNDTTWVNDQVKDTIGTNTTASANGTLATNLTGTIGTYETGDIVEYLGVKGKIVVGKIVDGKVPGYLQINDDTAPLLVYASANTTYGPTVIAHYPQRGTGEGEADIYVDGELIATMKYSKDASFNGYATMACDPDKYPDFAKNFTIKRFRDCHGLAENAGLPETNLTEKEIIEESILEISLPVYFSEKDEFTYWAVRIDGVNVTPKIPRAEFGKEITVAGMNLSEGSHLLSFAFYYPDGWWTRYVWEFTVPSDGTKPGVLLDVGDIKIDAPRLLDPKAFPLGQGPPPMKVVMEEFPVPALTKEPSKMECYVHVKSVINDPTLNVSGPRGESIVDVKRPDDADWVEAKFCMTLPDGTQISTGYDSAVVLDVVPVPPCEEKTTTITSLTLEVE